MVVIPKPLAKDKYVQEIYYTKQIGIISFKFTVPILLADFYLKSRYNVYFIYTFHYLFDFWTVFFLKINVSCFKFGVLH